MAIFARLSLAKIRTMARLNSPDMSPKRTKKASLGIYRTVSIYVRTVDTASDWLISNLGTENRENVYTHPSFHSLVHLTSLCLAFRFHSYQHTNTHQRTDSTEQHRILRLVCKKVQTFRWFVFPSIQEPPDAPFDTWSDRLRRYMNKHFINVSGNYDKK